MGEVIVLIIVGYVIVHLLAGHTVHRYSRRHGHRLNYGWSLTRGPWVGLRLLGGTFYRNV